MRRVTWFLHSSTPRIFQKPEREFDSEPQAHLARPAEAKQYLLQNSIARFAIVLTLTVLGDCSPVPPEDLLEPQVVPDYASIIAGYLKHQGGQSDQGCSPSPTNPCNQRLFKDLSTYTDFEISNARWVHAITGWNWLVCVRFKDSGHQRIYSMFLQDKAVINARYDTISDNCPAQVYSQFDVLQGAVARTTSGQLDPLH
jgi:hypothetical protein